MQFRGGSTGCGQRTRNEWQGLVAGWPRSGLAEEVYCARRGISLGSLQRWRRIFAEDAVPSSLASSAVSEFVPVTLIGDPHATAGAELNVLLEELDAQTGSPRAPIAWYISIGVPAVRRFHTPRPFTVRHANSRGSE